jgi:hypothetical protein
MSNRQISILFVGETGDITAENVEVTQVGPDLYRIEEDICSFMIADKEEELELMPRFGDLIRASFVEEGTVQFITVYERTGMKQYEFILGEDLFERPGYHSLIQEIINQDGYVERQFGGILLISIPDMSNYDPTSAIEGL